MPAYFIEITARAGCGCEASIEFALQDETEPAPGDVGAVLYSAMDPEATNLLDFLMSPHHEGGHEKLTVTACVKVRS